jgi:hypothetical protein
LVGLNERDFERVEFLAGILRLAVALNRSRRGIVKGIALKRGRLPELRLILRRSSDPTVELQQVEREREALEKAIRWHFVVDYERSSMRGLKRRSSKKKAVKLKKSSAKLAERLLRSSSRRHLTKT